MIVFPGFVYTPARVTLGGSPYLLGRVTLLAGLTFYLVNGRSVLCRIAYLGNAQKVKFLGETTELMVYLNNFF